MLLRDLGGEFAFLERIVSTSGNKDVVVPNGDDASVVRFGSELLSVTTDTIVDGDHFNVSYFTPEQIGSKLVEASASDIVAMGGLPLYLYISLCIPRDMEAELLFGVYDGIQKACERIGATVMGGDTTHGDKFILSSTVLGRIKDEKHVCPRSGAMPGDEIYLSGPLGGSTAGLRLLLKGVEGHEEVKRFHLEPRCRLDLVSELAPVANAMIDISDGLSSELHHICRMSGCGAVINEASVPVSEGALEAATVAGDKVMDYVYSGGEDFELLYTLDPRYEGRVSGVRIGTITAEREILVERDGGLVELPNRGFDHFRE